MINEKAASGAIFATGATYYVNGSTGSDSNDGLSAGTAFRTIQKAVDSCGTVNNMGYYNWSTPGNIISIDSASTYSHFYVVNKNIAFVSDGTISISTSGVINIVGGYVALRAPMDITYSGATAAINVQNNAILRQQSAITITASNLTYYSYYGALNLTAGGMVMGLANLTISLNTGIGILCNFGARYIHTGGTVSITTTKTGISCEQGDFRSSSTVTIASGADLGFNVNGGIVTYGTVNNSASTAYTTSNGGRIYTGTQTSAPNY